MIWSENWKNFASFNNAHRVRTALDGDIPLEINGETTSRCADLNQIPVEVSLPRAVPVTRGSLNKNSPYAGRFDSGLGLPFPDHPPTFRQTTFSHSAFFPML